MLARIETAVKNILKNLENCNDWKGNLLRFTCFETEILLNMTLKNNSEQLLKKLFVFFSLLTFKKFFYLILFETSLNFTVPTTVEHQQTIQYRYGPRSRDTIK